MTVEDLIGLLQTQDPKRLVVIAHTNPAHWHSPLSRKYGANAAYANHRVGLEYLTAKNIEDGYSEEDVLYGGQRALVLYPED